MDVAVGIKLVEILLANLPAIIDTAPKLIKYLTDGFKALTAAWNNESPSTPEEIDALIARIVQNHVRIQAID